jgi:glycosyltransferase involved in cell wall biosynthesis
VHVVLPIGGADAARPSGGNIYDQRICRELLDLGWQVRQHGVAGSWPWPDDEAREGLAGAIRCIPDGEPLMVDGLIASVSPQVLVPAARRLPLVVLVHMALGDQPSGHVVADAEQREAEVLAAARAIVTTSHWTRDRLLDLYPVPPAQVTVASPGVDPADPAAGTGHGGQLLCVGALAPHKGQDVLLDALVSLLDLHWQCLLVGGEDRDPAYVAQLRRQVAAELRDRVTIAGTRTGAALAGAYAEADLLVVPSRVESYGMVVIEGLAHSLPVIAASVGGLPEALGRAIDGRAPGLLVPPDDPPSLAAALRSWLTDADRRRSLRDAARARRGALPNWSDTGRCIAEVVERVA